MQGGLVEENALFLLNPFGVVRTFLVLSITCEYVQFLTVSITPVGTDSFGYHVLSIIFALLLYAFKPFISTMANAILIHKNALHSAGAPGFEPGTCSLGGCRHILARPRAPMGIGISLIKNSLMRNHKINENYGRNMRKGLLYLGVALVIMGFGAYIIFPAHVFTPAYSVNSKNYDVGDKITVYGVITDIKYSPLLNATIIELDGKLDVLAHGNIEGCRIGDEVYMTIKKTSAVSVGNFQITYWSTEKGDMGKVKFYRDLSQATAVLGIILMIVGTILCRE